MKFAFSGRLLRLIDDEGNDVIPPRDPFADRIPNSARAQQRRIDECARRMQADGCIQCERCNKLVPKLGSAECNGREYCAPCSAAAVIAAFDRGFFASAARSAGAP
jgi:hypothetical protein